MSEITSKTEAFGQDVYFVNGYTVSEDTYKTVKNLENERDELREFKEKVNKELRIWNNDDCSEKAYMKALCNIEEMMLEGGE